MSEPIIPKVIEAPSKLSPKQLFDQGKPPHITDLHGKYDVKILSGIFRMYRTSSWHKIIYGLDPLIPKTGYNIINGLVQGFFEMHQEIDQVILDYNLPKNSPGFWAPMRDYLRIENNSNRYIGKIFIRLFKVYIPAGYFSLIPYVPDNEKASVQNQCNQFHGILRPISGT